MDFAAMRFDCEQLLANSQICLSEKALKSFGTLPKEAYHPFEDEAMNFREAMELTYNGLQFWQPRGREICRFDKEYIKISRMIENTVVTLARGLMTLHVNGLDLSEAPVDIKELLSVASFHFRKCYKGARAAANSNPQAFMRLFSTQLRWLNLLQRLEQREAKLAKPVQTTKKLTDKKRASGANVESAVRSFSAPDALDPLTGIGAARAYRPLRLDDSSQPEVVIEPAFDAETFSGEPESSAANAAADIPDEMPRQLEAETVDPIADQCSEPDDVASKAAPVNEVESDMVTADDCTESGQDNTAEPYDDDEENDEDLSEWLDMFGIGDSYGIWGPIFKPIPIRVDSS